MSTLRRSMLVLLSAGILPLPAQRESGELRLSVSDGAGNALLAAVSVVSQATQVARTFQTDIQGRVTFEALPFGPYRLDVTRAGFRPWNELLEIRSPVPVTRHVSLDVAPVSTTVVVTEGSTLLDPEHTGSENHIGPDLLRDRRSAQAGRSVLEMVNTQPGWLLEANGVLHPRGSEYEVQYVVDGLPLFDNRSPSYAQSMSVEEFQSMRVLTGGYRRSMAGSSEALSRWRRYAIPARASTQRPRSRAAVSTHRRDISVGSIAAAGLRWA